MDTGRGLELGPGRGLPCSGAGQGVLERAGADGDRVRCELGQSGARAGGRSAGAGWAWGSCGSLIPSNTYPHPLVL